MRGDSRGLRVCVIVAHFSNTGPVAPIAGLGLEIRVAHIPAKSPVSGVDFGFRHGEN